MGENRTDGGTMLMKRAWGGKKSLKKKKFKKKKSVGTGREEEPDRGGGTAGKRREERRRRGAVYFHDFIALLSIQTPAFPPPCGAITPRRDTCKMVMKTRSAARPPGDGFARPARK